MTTIYVIGTGPGESAYLTPLAWDCAKRCVLLVGGKRALQHFSELEREKYYLDAETLPRLPDIIRDGLTTGSVGVLASGDPGLFSILGTLLKHFDREQVEVVPGVSSLQCLFARLKRSWEGVYLFSTHSKKEAFLTPEEIELIDAHESVAIFAGRSLTPARMARLLLAEGIDDRLVTVGENLSHPDERITQGSLEEIKEMTASELSIMLLDKIHR